MAWYQILTVSIIGGIVFYLLIKVKNLEDNNKEIIKLLQNKLLGNQTIKDKEEILFSLPPYTHSKDCFCIMCEHERVHYPDRNEVRKTKIISDFHLRNKK